jgi:CheY-like chemotaxis protein
VITLVLPLPAPATPQAAPSGHETVLLVEDEPMLRELGTTVLEELGYRVFSAENGADALRVLEENPDVPIDLLLTDVVMPGMSGPKLAEQLTAAFPKMRVLFMSGYPGTAIVQGGSLQSGVAYIEKPFTPTVLLEKVRQALKGYLRAGAG